MPAADRNRLQSMTYEQKREYVETYTSTLFLFLSLNSSLPLTAQKALVDRVDQGQTAQTILSQGSVQDVPFSLKNYRGRKKIK